MFKTAKRTAAAVLCAALTFAALPALPAAAVSGEEQPEPEYMTALYNDYDPVGDDILCIAAHEKADIRIVQHSPERENLVLFDCTVYPFFTPLHYFRMEPGDYTIYISMQNIKGGATKSVYKEDFTIENADYSVAPNQFENTFYDITLSTIALEDNAEAVPESKRDEEPTISENQKYIRNDITFGRYTLMRGDYDNDKEITALDAQNVLQAFAVSLTGDPDAEELTCAQQAACDIDGEGNLTALDAQHILLYYAESIVGDTPSWPNETPEPGYETEED